MNHPYSPPTPPSGNSDADRAAARTDGSRGSSIALLSEPNALTPRQLESRQIIHRADSVREQADAFRALRTRLLAVGGDTNFVTLVVPVTHGCGGSFVARNLAAAFAFDEAKTALLLDCDAWHPAQHAALHVDANHGGLMDYLSDSGMDPSQVIYATGVPRLRLIPSGRIHETTSEAFSSFRMRTLMDSLRSRYADRYLFLDGPPALGAPDAHILSELADLVVLVAGYGRVTPKQLEAATASFPPEKLAGVIFNQLP